jgi:hypothetical protein
LREQQPWSGRLQPPRAAALVRSGMKTCLNRRVDGSRRPSSAVSPHLQSGEPDNRYFRDYPVSGHAANMLDSARMTHTGSRFGFIQNKAPGAFTVDAILPYNLLTFRRQEDEELNPMRAGDL